ncbi:hypothetical protein O181_009236 [Austropuccinia psidii MF-1]|uniref:Uncharacterized protein n=1 Tax=Austropuccinia psidii MF-1 TaxID=1389203 RepID=A0A9Q3BRF1_9BASI|nr:hypothetical protein [Austropuccinia psidii MF-1]
MPIIPEPQLKLSMSVSNRDKSHSQSSKQHFYEPVKEVSHSVQGQRFGKFTTNPPRIDGLLANPEKIPQRGGNSEILQWIYSTIIRASNQEDKGIPCQKEGRKQERSPSSFYQQSSSQPTSPIREE